MKSLPFFLSLIIGAAAGHVLDGTPFGIGACLIAGGLGGLFAGIMPKGSELIYWLFVAGTFGLFAASITVVDLDGLTLMLPLVFTGNYFIARLLGRVTGTRASLSS